MIGNKKGNNTIATIAQINGNIENMSNPIPVNTNSNKMDTQNTTIEAIINIHTLLATATTAAFTGIKIAATTAAIVKIAKAIARFFIIHTLK